MNAYSSHSYVQREIALGAAAEGWIGDGTTVFKQAEGVSGKSKADS